MTRKQKVSLTDEEFRSRDVVPLSEIARRLSRTERHCWRLSEKGDFPPIIRVGPNAVGVRTRDYLEWLANRPAHVAANTKEAA